MNTQMMTATLTGDKREQSENDDTSYGHKFVSF